jgi:hypothetical protein
MEKNNKINDEGNNGEEKSNPSYLNTRIYKNKIEEIKIRNQYLEYFNKLEKNNLSG